MGAHSGHLFRCSLDPYHYCMLTRNWRRNSVDDKRSVDYHRSALPSKQPIYIYIAAHFPPRICLFLLRFSFLIFYLLDLCLENSINGDHCKRHLIHSLYQQANTCCLCNFPSSWENLISLTQTQMCVKRVNLIKQLNSIRHNLNSPKMVNCESHYKWSSIKSSTLARHQKTH